MAWRAVCVVVSLGVGGGCFADKYPDRYPCEDASAADCCPPGSHQAVSDNNPEFIICVANDAPCSDAGSDAAACEEAGAHAP